MTIGSATKWAISPSTPWSCSTARRRFSRTSRRRFRRRAGGADDARRLLRLFRRRCREEMPRAVGRRKGAAGDGEMLFEPPNFLVLDEPTNHLDIATKEMLIKALSAFEGAMLFVSHDRHILAALSNRVFELTHRRGCINIPAATANMWRPLDRRRRGCAMNPGGTMKVIPDKDRRRGPRAALVDAARRAPRLEGF